VEYDYYGRQIKRTRLRRAYRFRRLQISTKGHPHFWRKSALTVSIASLLLFDILANVSAAFADAEFLAVFAVPAFVAYLVFNHIALAVVVQGIQEPF
jgi:hypothetical protein